MMRTLKILLFLFISCLCFGCQSSLRRESRIEKQDDVYVLSFANLSFSVSAGKGGRIVSFKCEDRELLTSDSNIMEQRFGCLLNLNIGLNINVLMSYLTKQR